MGAEATLDGSGGGRYPFLDHVLRKKAGGISPRRTVLATCKCVPTHVYCVCGICYTIGLEKSSFSRVLGMTAVEL